MTNSPITPRRPPDCSGRSPSIAATPTPTYLALSSAPCYPARRPVRTTTAIRRRSFTYSKAPPGTDGASVSSTSLTRSGRLRFHSRPYRSPGDQRIRRAPNGLGCHPLGPRPDRDQPPGAGQVRRAGHPQVPPPLTQPLVGDPDSAVLRSASRQGLSPTVQRFMLGQRARGIALP